MDTDLNTVFSQSPHAENLVYIRRLALEEARMGNAWPLLKDARLPLLLPALMTCAHAASTRVFL